jgi:hypothetical protein
MGIVRYTLLGINTQETSKTHPIGYKTAQGLMKQVLRYKDVFIELINHAYVPSEMKEDYINLISQSAGAKRVRHLMSFAICH